MLFETQFYDAHLIEGLRKNESGIPKLLEVQH